MITISQKANQVKLKDLVSIADAAKELGLSWWQTRRRMDQGKLLSAKLPNGHRAVIRPSLEAYKKGPEMKKTAPEEAAR